jgi:hypothetical protein
LDYFDDCAGAQIDARHTDQIVNFISHLQQDEVRWRSYADHALDIAGNYSASAYQQSVDKYLREIQAHYF